MTSYAEEYAEVPRCSAITTMAGEVADANGAPTTSPTTTTGSSVDPSAAVGASSHTRMATTGSIRAARSAGIQHATIPMAAIITATATNVTGSCGGTPKSSPRALLYVHLRSQDPSYGIPI